MSLVGNFMRGRARKRYRREAEQTVRHLQDLDNESMGLVLAIVSHHRNALIKDGIDLRDLTAFVRQAPMYQLDLAKAVNVLIRKKRHHDALGLQIWMHSLRCVADEPLHDLGVEIWRQLKRGQPHVAKARELVKEETGFELDINMANEMPGEFA